MRESQGAHAPLPGSEGRGVLLQNYRRGRQVHWSGVSSASPSREVAAAFAGPGGVLLRLDLLPDGSRARDIRALSAIAAEQEASPLPPPPPPPPPPQHTLVL
jgi:hypothetical protein